jgi:hypothetical protein
MPIYVLEPPARYNHAYAGPVVERVLPLEEARRACARMGVHADACAWQAKGTCYMVIPHGGPVKDLAAYVRHERAHCNGWGEHHAGSGHAGAHSFGASEWGTVDDVR